MIKFLLLFLYDYHVMKKYFFKDAIINNKMLTDDSRGKNIRWIKKFFFLLFVQDQLYDCKLSRNLNLQLEC